MAAVAPVLDAEDMTRTTTRDTPASGLAIDPGARLTGASEHGVSEAIYVTDPDGNGLELSWDRPRDEWPRTVDGRLAPINLPLDTDALLALPERHAPR
jgi:catechol-2,3-dioxygenase